MTKPKHIPANQFHWYHELKQIFVLALERYRAGERDPQRYFTGAEQAYLASIGQTAQEIFDYAEDHSRDGEPDWETVLLISAARRDYLFAEQNGQPSTRVISMEDLPPKDAALEGIPWLPRLIKKAEAKLRGEMSRDLMYDCGGDRTFLKQHGINPADFLRHVWAARGDEQKMIALVKKSDAAMAAQSENLI